MDMVRWHILAFFDLLKNNHSLASDIDRGHTGVAGQVGQNINRDLKMFIENTSRIARLFFGSKRVERSTN